MRINPKKYQIARARAGISTTQMVQKYGLRRATVTRAASGQNCLPETVGRIAKALGCDVTEIIDTD